VMADMPDSHCQKAEHKRHCHEDTRVILTYRERNTVQRRARHDPEWSTGAWVVEA
jgi:hypothetical protein